MYYLVYLLIIASINLAEDKTQQREIQALIEKLNSDDSKVRDKAEEKLVKIGEPAVRALAKALQRGDEDFRYNVAITLIGFRSKTGPKITRVAIHALIKAIEKDPSATVRRGATYALAEIGPTKEAVPALIHVLEKENNYDAARALRKIGPDAKAAVPALMKAARKKGEQHWSLRMDAIKALASIQHDLEKVVPLFCESFGDPDADVRKTAILSLAILGPKAKAAIPCLLKKLKGDRDTYLTGFETAPKGMDLRLAAAFALVKIDPNNPVGINAILRLGKDKKEWMTRAMACFYLMFLDNRSKPVITFLEEMIKDENRHVRATAETTLKKLRKKQ